MSEVLERSLAKALKVVQESGGIPVSMTKPTPTPETLDSGIKESTALLSAKKFEEFITKVISGKADDDIDEINNKLAAIPLGDFKSWFCVPECVSKNQTTGNPYRNTLITLIGKLEEKITINGKTLQPSEEMKKLIAELEGLQDRESLSATAVEEWNNKKQTQELIDGIKEQLKYQQKELEAWKKKVNKQQADWKKLSFTGLDAYKQLKAAAEVFVMVNCGTKFDVADNASYETEEIPYMKIIRARLGEYAGMTEEERGYYDLILQRKLENPCLIELIWSYWHEESMLVQALNALCLRFQNKRSGYRDALANLNLDPIRPLNNIIWGYIQDEPNRLTLQRRAYEYDQHYGLKLCGKAVQNIQSVESRSKFLESFHNLLYICSVFFKQEDDSMVNADGFPVLNSLKDVQILLTQGMHNQYGDLPATSRVEMLIQQWILGRPEMRQFLGGRTMVPYPENWMDHLDTIKTAQGWTDVSSMHFHNLAIYGEQTLLSIRYGNWTESNKTREEAANWAREWRSEIQGYIHAYRAVTGVDITNENSVKTEMPSHLMMKKAA